MAAMSRPLPFKVVGYRGFISAFLASVCEIMYYLLYTGVVK